MQLKRVKYEYDKIKDKKGIDYEKFKKEISDISNTVYFFCKNEEYVSVRFTKNTLSERLYQNTPKVNEVDDFAKSDEIVALLFENNGDETKLRKIKNAFAAYYGLSERND